MLINIKTKNLLAPVVSIDDSVRADLTYHNCPRDVYKGVVQKQQAMAFP